MANPTRPGGSGGVKRVEQLLRLATDPAASEEEARSAAIAAARGIRAQGLVVSAPGEAQQRPYGSYGTAATRVTPEGRQLGMGAPALPRRQAPARRELAPYEPGRGGAHVVNLDFKDEVPREKVDAAFPASLLALLGR